MSGTILPTYAADAYLYGTPQAVPQQAVQPSILGSLFDRPASPLVSQQTANQAAIDTLLNIAGGTANDAAYGGPGPTGAPSTGSFMGDLAAANRAGLTEAALGMVANPTGLAVSVPATMAAIGVNALTGMPAKGLADIAGLRGLATQLSHVPSAIRNSVEGYPEKSEPASLEGGTKGPTAPDDKPASLSAEEAAAAAASTETGGAKGEQSSPATGAHAGEDNATSNSTAAGQDAAGPGDPGAAGEGDGDNYAVGGLVGYARGGVIQLEGGGKVAIGPGGGLDDLIPTSINGQRAAALSDGEFVVPADVVSMMGDGSSNAGARRLYDLVRQIRQEKTGTSKQAGPLPVGELLKRTMS